MMCLEDIYLSAAQWLSFEKQSFEMQNLVSEVISDKSLPAFTVENISKL